jgi:hypothetical protein
MKSCCSNVLIKIPFSASGLIPVAVIKEGRVIRVLVVEDCLKKWVLKRSKELFILFKAPFDNGLTEHEFDHVMIGYYDENPVINRS